MGTQGAEEEDKAPGRANTTPEARSLSAMAHLEQLWAIAEQREGVPPLLLKGATGERNRHGDCAFTMGQALFGAIFCPLLYHTPCRMSLQGRSSGGGGVGRGADRDEVTGT